MLCLSMCHDAMSEKGNWDSKFIWLKSKKGEEQVHKKRRKIT